MGEDKGEHSTGISQMRVDLGERDRTWPSWNPIGHRPHLPFKVEVTAIGTGGTPEAQVDSRTTPSHSFIDPSPFPHGAPSLSSSARSHSHPPTANDHPGLGAARSRPIRPRIAANNARGTATSASWKVTAPA